MKRRTIFILTLLLIVELVLYLIYRVRLYAFVTTQLQIKATDFEVNIFATALLALINTINFAFASRIGRIQDNILKNTVEPSYFVNSINSSIEIGHCLQIVYGPGILEPRFQDFGSLKLTQNDLVRKREIIKNFKQNYTDDPCAAVVDKPIWSDNPLIIRYYKNTFAEILSLRHDKQYISIVSANVLIFSEELNCIVVHRRSAASQDYAGTLHTFGGAFIPPGSGNREDHSGIRQAAKREIFEESVAGIHIPDSTKRVVIDEFKIQFIQLAYLGVNVTAEQVRDMRGNWEGDPIQIPFSELGKKLTGMNEWTPTGWVHVLLWLGLDTPGASKPIKFGKLSGSELAKSISQKYLTKGEL